MDRPRHCRDSANDVCYDYSRTPPSPLRLCLLQGVGVGEGRDKERAPVPAPGGAICLQGPQVLGANVAHDCLCLGPSPTRGAFRKQWQHRLQGWLGLWWGRACPGELGPYFPLLGWPALFCTGLGPSRAVREPSGGAPPRFILRLALRAASWPEPPSGDARGSGRRAGGWPGEHSKAPLLLVPGQQCVC